MAYNPFEMSAIVAVRDLKEYNWVDPKYLDKNGEPVYAPRLRLCSLIALTAGSLQQRIEEDTYRPFKGSSVSGGSHIQVDYPNSFDAFVYRGKMMEINVA